MDLYVYYKVQAARAAGLQAAAIAMQAALAEAHGVAPQLKRRPPVPAADGMQTWMEVYPAVGDTFPQLLDAAVAKARLAQWISGARHVEIFEDVPPCA